MTYKEVLHAASKLGMLPYVTHRKYGTGNVVLIKPDGIAVQFSGLRRDSYFNKSQLHELSLAV